MIMNRGENIEHMLHQSFKVESLEVVNESHVHSVPVNSETHFKVIIVSKDFEGKSKVARHQSIYAVLGEELNNGLHALALHAYSPEEWKQNIQSSPDSPNCMGGSKAS